MSRLIAVSVTTMMMLVVAIEVWACEESQVLEKSFCVGKSVLSLECRIPISERVPLQELESDAEGNRIIWLWSLTCVPHTQRIMYTFYSEDGRVWSQRIHFHWLDNTIKIAETIRQNTMQALQIISTGGLPSDQNLQAIGFTVKRESLNRWPVNFKVTKGRYWFEIRTLSGDVINGGKRLEIEVFDSTQNTP